MESENANIIILFKCLEKKFVIGTNPIISICEFNQCCSPCQQRLQTIAQYKIVYEHFSQDFKQRETFNIGTGVPTSVNELAQILIDLLAKGEAKVAHAEERRGNIRESYASISKTKKELRFERVFSINEGLEKLVTKSSSSLS